MLSVFVCGEITLRAFYFYSCYPRVPSSTSFLVLITMDRRVELVIAHIESDVAGALDTAELAALVNLSASRFRHLFKEETGRTINQYVRGRRLERAEFLLRTTFLSIKEVMKQSGVSSMSHFVPYFKKRYGVSPSGYRKKLATFVKH